LKKANKIIKCRIYLFLRYISAIYALRCVEILKLFASFKISAQKVKINLVINRIVAYAYVLIGLIFEGKQMP